ncbi:hypothetical protein OS493_009562 [Desmophyllum pertusum]|uniref:Histidine N-acetyltransferase C-terminal domain-containing protein n=1 Tax=Desmophyllum pertusum TaxID=174260 RepID=A0A9W9YR00_9CNID|nr:hypothetical protein OS493_009562 [Desmophyllum pertusum]
MFPGRTIVVDWEPFEALRSNIDCIFEDGDCVFSDRDANDCSRGQLPKSFAHGRRSPRVQHMHWVASIYTEDPVMFQVHVVEQLRSACEKVEGDFIFSTFHKERHTKWGKKLLEETIGLKPVLEEDAVVAIVLYEDSVKWKYGYSGLGPVDPPSPGVDASEFFGPKNDSRMQEIHGRIQRFCSAFKDGHSTSFGVFLHEE